MLNADEKPRDGIERLLAIGGTDQQVKALKDCSVGSRTTSCRCVAVVVPQVTTPQGLVSYHVNGFKRDEHGVR